MSLKQLRWWAVSYVVGLAVYAWWSFGLTAPNLVLSSWQPYWQFQTKMWQLLFDDRLLLAGIFAAAVGWLVVTYLGLVAGIARAKLSKLPSWRWLVVIWLAITAPLVVASNALSYDVFNYIFNAKMVLVYQANPHIRVALDFAQDPWTRFMHNTHTPAPYGYGWTALSLLPFAASGGKYLLNWLLFRGMGLASVGLTFAALWLVAQRVGKQLRLVDLAIVFLNPLLIIEVVSNMHNDLWMMAPAVAALGLVAPGAVAGDSSANSKPRLGAKVVLASAALLLISISIKLATLALLPLWLGLAACRLSLGSKLGSSLKGRYAFTLQRWAAWSDQHWPLLASLAMMAPLLTPRSQQFLPWYLTWVIVWLPLMSNGKWQGWWRLAVIALSITSLLRYLPFLLAGDYSGQVLSQQKLITWLPWLLSLIPLYWWQRRTYADTPSGES